MAERNYEVKTVGVEYVCDKCGQGTMRPTGIMLTMSPPKWGHKCNHCGELADLNQTYPTVRTSARLPACAQFAVAGRSGVINIVVLNVRAANF